MGTLDSDARNPNAQLQASLFASRERTRLLRGRVLDIPRTHQIVGASAIATTIPAGSFAARDRVTTFKTRLRFSSALPSGNVFSFGNATGAISMWVSNSAINFRAGGATVNTDASSVSVTINPVAGLDLTVIGMVRLDGLVGLWVVELGLIAWDSTGSFSSFANDVVGDFAQAAAQPLPADVASSGAPANFSVVEPLSVFLGNLPRINVGTARGAPLFNPLQVSGLSLRLDASQADTITLNGANVSQWDDISGNGNNATQITASQQPPYNAQDSRANGQASVGPTVNTGSVGLELPSLTVTHFFMVIGYEDGTDATFDERGTLVSGPGSFGTERIMGDVGTANLDSTGGGFNFTTQVSINDGAFGAAILPLPLSCCIFVGNVTQAFSLGYNNSAVDRSWKGPICEVLAYNNALMTTEEQSTVAKFLCTKWGIPT
ncbi:gp70 [Alphaproteobacteria phage PhiJL001]|uniref:Gp70 n=1 Tax=Alphaproteobacteria phage PhiJL001 TaxID=2681607 RepID=Q5DN35_9CAUD|nr:gp70 [Alphaproteobacteria phage PhiJL001]AAT69546.1 gp70 [Alphaproteobacteria phage PhiJL001]